MGISLRHKENNIGIETQFIGYLLFDTSIIFIKNIFGDKSDFFIHDKIKISTKSQANPF